MKKYIIVSTLTLLSVSFSGSALSADQCVNIPADAERLACYDDRFATESAVSENGDWVTNTEINNLDDSKTVASILEAEEGDGRFGERIAFVARCQSNTTDAYIIWNHFLGNDMSYTSHRRAKRVTYRIGDEPAQEASWSVSTDNKATFISNPIAFLRSMAGHGRLVAQLTPHGESPVQAVFNISGTEEALQELSQTCNWEF